MDYLKRPKYHFKPKRGWINDPNGLVCFGGYYHMFYQHFPDAERPSWQATHWGHARSKDLQSWEELPVALYPDKPYDINGCWSGTATVKDDTLYLFYASVRKKEGTEELIQTVSVAYSKDGINFEKYENNPVIATYPEDGSPDFRDPAVCHIDGKYYCVMASGNPEAKEGRLLLYTSEDMFNWTYLGIMSSWAGCKFAECPSFVPAGDKYLLTTSLCTLDDKLSFAAMFGSFKDGKFTPEYTASVDKGPDQYAGQVFHDDKGRNILISWMPGWRYAGFVEKDIGCMSCPRELTLKDGKITGFPVTELRHLLTDSDPALRLTDKGFVIERAGRTPVVYEGEIRDIKILRDEHFIEVYVNGGEEIYTALL
jgi:beta-fructofuranosidase